MTNDKLRVVSLYNHNYRGTTKTLRSIADRIDAGEFGEVGAVGLVLLGDQMRVFGMGPDSEAPSIALLLRAGFMRLSRTIEEHGK